MFALRSMIGYVVGGCYAFAALLLMGLAWMGLENSFGMLPSIGFLVLSIAVRVNLFVVIGGFLFALNIWGMGAFEALLFVLPSGLILEPGMVRSVWRALTGVAVPEPGSALPVNHPLAGRTSSTNPATIRRRPA